MPSQSPIWVHHDPEPYIHCSAMSSWVSPQSCLDFGSSQKAIYWWRCYQRLHECTWSNTYWRKRKTWTLWENKANPHVSIIRYKKSGILTQDMLAQLDEAPCVDESTDICDNTQLLVYVRFYSTRPESILWRPAGYHSSSDENNWRRHLPDH